MRRLYLTGGRWKLMGPTVVDGTTGSMRNGIINRGSEQAGGTFVAVQRKEETSETSAEKWYVQFLFFLFVLYSYSHIF